MMTGGAGAVGLFGSCLMMISPGAGGVGGFKYRTAISCTYSSFCLSRLFMTSGHASSFIGYALIGKSPFHLQTSHLFAKMPRLPAANISCVSFIVIGSVDLKMAASISLI